MINVISTEIEGVYIIEPKVFGDARGYFFESFSKKDFTELVGDVDFVQDNESMSTYGKHVAVELTEDNHRQLFIPRGFAHGFSVLSEKAIFQYKCDNFYHPEADGGICITDESLGIDWGIPVADAILSDKDTKHAMLADFDSPFLY